MLFLLSTPCAQPLLSTGWDQIWPYNSFCPVDENVHPQFHDHVPAGCSAVAMSQILKFFEYPSSGHDEFEYETTYGTLTPGFTEAPFRWQLMPDSITVSSDSNTVAAVARLMYQAAVAVRSKFGTSVTSSNAYNERQAFLQHFHYSPSVLHYNRTKFTSAEWSRRLINELDHNRPVMYSASDTIRDISHVFIIDGYRGEGTDLQFHCNWGWGGRHNGYYPLDSLVPGDIGAFTAEQYAMMGISPPRVSPPDSVQYDVTGNNLRLEWLTTVDTNRAGYQVIGWPADEGFPRFRWPLLGPQSSSFTVYDLSGLIDQHDSLYITLAAVDRDSIVSLFTDSLLISNSLLALRKNYADRIRPPLLTVTSLPFHSPVEIKVHTGSNAPANIDIYTISGRLVRSFNPITGKTGTCSILFNWINSHGDRAGSGSYLLRLKAGERTATRLITLFKPRTSIIIRLKGLP